MDEFITEMLDLFYAIKHLYKKIGGMTREEAIEDLRKYMRPATSEELEAEQTYIDSISIKFKKVVYGEWLSDEDGNIYCSVCGRGGVGESFCEHCGADMRGGNNENS